MGLGVTRDVPLGLVLVMHDVLILGAGKIGSTIAHFFADSRDYRVTVADRDEAALERIRARHGEVQTARVDLTTASELTAACRGATPCSRRCRSA